MKIIKLNNSDLVNLVTKVIKEQEEANYMFFSNVEQIKRQCEMILKMDKNFIDEILIDGHDWADDHMTEAKVNLDQVFDFIINEKNKRDQYVDFEQINESKSKPTNPKLWKQSLDWAKSRYKVCPSAYCNGAAAKRYKSKGGRWKTEK
jgi:hypothetical protein